MPGMKELGEYLDDVVSNVRDDIGVFIEMTVVLLLAGKNIVCIRR
jgi:hypothetical protein